MEPFIAPLIIGSMTSSAFQNIERFTGNLQKEIRESDSKTERAFKRGLLLLAAGPLAVKRGTSSVVNGVAKALDLDHLINEEKKQDKAAKHFIAGLAGIAGALMAYAAGPVVGIPLAAVAAGTEAYAVNPLFTGAIDKTRQPRRETPNSAMNKLKQKVSNYFVVGSSTTPQANNTAAAAVAGQEVQNQQNNNTQPPAETPAPLPAPTTTPNIPPAPAENNQNNRGQNRNREQANTNIRMLNPVSMGGNIYVPQVNLADNTLNLLPVSAQPVQPAPAQPPAQE